MGQAFWIVLKSLRSLLPSMPALLLTEIGLYWSLLRLASSHEAISIKPFTRPSNAMHPAADLVLTLFPSGLPDHSERGPLPHPFAPYHTEPPPNTLWCHSPVKRFETAEICLSCQTLLSNWDRRSSERDRMEALGTLIHSLWVGGFQRLGQHHHWGFSTRECCIWSCPTVMLTSLLGLLWCSALCQHQWHHTNEVLRLEEGCDHCSHQSEICLQSKARKIDCVGCEEHFDLLITNAWI